MRTRNLAPAATLSVSGKRVLYKVFWFSHSPSPADRFQLDSFTRRPACSSLAPFLRTVLGIWWSWAWAAPEASRTPKSPNTTAASKAITSLHPLLAPVYVVVFIVFSFLGFLLFFLLVSCAPASAPLRVLEKGRRYLYAVLRPHSGEPLDVGRFLRRRGRGLAGRRLADVLHEAFVHPARRLAHQHPAGRRARVPEGVQGALGHVDKQARAGLDPGALDGELEPALQHVEALVFPVLDVGFLAAAWAHRHLEERVGPSGLLARDLAGDEL